MVVGSCRESKSRIQGIGRGNGKMGVGLKWGSGREVYKRSERKKGLKTYQGCLIDD